MAHPLAGQPAPSSSLADIPALLAAYHRDLPDLADPAQRVAFGTSGHRGSALNRSFNEAHLLAIAQAVAEYRAGAGITGPLFLGMDTHALSAPAQRTTLEVLAANGVEVRFQADGGFTPTPVISHAILDSQRRAHGGPCRRHRHHPLAQPAAGWRHQVQPAARRAGRHRRHRLDRAPRQRTARRRQPRRQARDLRAGAGGADDQRGRPDERLHFRPRQRHRHGSDPPRRPAHRRRSHGRRRGRLLEADRRALRARPHRRQPGGRSGLRLHDPRPRRQDPHGLLQPVRHGQPGRAQGPLRHRLGQRRRRRPPRHRHARRSA